MKQLLLLLVVLSFTFVLSDKIHPKLYEYYGTHGLEEQVSFFALLKSKADVLSAVEGTDFEERGHIVFNELTNIASKTQKPLLEWLDTLEVQYKSYWIVNMVLISANYSTMVLIAKHDLVREVEPNFEFQMDLPVPDLEPAVESPEAIEWNIAWVRAPQAWNIGIDGKGLVVANADTGVQWNHPALQPQYRGYKGSSTNVTHDYNWWDSVHTTGSSCGANTKAPCDDNGHGTHTTGTSVGSDGSTNQIGVAPGAKWIACRNMNAGKGSPATYMECMQFFIAPTDLSGKNPNPTLRPHVIGNSWGCPTSEGCSATTLLEAVTNVVSAGIFMSVSAGNSGPSCSTVSDPPAIYANVMSVAASAYNSNGIASFSSRGPVTVDKSNRPKPDITAPGQTIRSAYPTNRYSSLSGTSMASPHITGVVALLWQAQPSLVRDIAKTTAILTATATSLSNTACSSSMSNSTYVPRGTTRNNVFGYGMLDCLAAVNSKN